MNILNKLRSGLFVLVASFAFVAVPVAVPAVASAADNSIGTCVKQGAGLNLDNVGSNCTAPATSNSGVNLTKTVKTIINIFSVIVGAVAVIMIIWGGLKYVTSGGDSGNVTSAKNTIIYALVGLVVVALAQFIVQFVLDKLVA